MFITTVCHTFIYSNIDWLIFFQYSPFVAWGGYYLGVASSDTRLYSNWDRILKDNSGLRFHIQNSLFVIEIMNIWSSESVKSKKLAIWCHRISRATVSTDAWHPLILGKKTWNYNKILFEIFIVLQIQLYPKKLQGLRDHRQ